MAEEKEIPSGYFARVTLRKPVVRGDQKISSILLRDPHVPDLLDISVYDLMRMHVPSITKVLPCISEPPLRSDEVNEMGAPDILSIGQEISGFLLL